MDRQRAEQRLFAVARHINPLTEHHKHHDNEPQAETIAAQPCGSSVVKTAAYASATGRPSKYALMHGDVSSAPVVWQRGEVDGPRLQDVIYETAVGEGIAKVGG